MDDDLIVAGTEHDAPRRDYSRAFVAFTLLLSVAAIASLVIAVSVPVDRGVNYFGRPPAELVGPGPDTSASAVREVAMPKGCIPDASIRLTSPKRLEAVRVCLWRSGAITPPITVLNSPRTSLGLSRLSKALAEPSNDVSMVYACPASWPPPSYVSVRISGRWYAAQLPTESCGSPLPSVSKSLDALLQQAAKS